MRTGTHLGLAVLKAVGLTTLVGLVLVAGLGTPSPGGDRSQPDRGAYERVAERAASDHRCSPGTRGRPAPSALIRTSGGRLRTVSFEQGWEVYSGRRPGRLVAVCLGER